MYILFWLARSAARRSVYNTSKSFDRHFADSSEQ